MKRYTVNQEVAPGIYFCVRRLAFRSMDEAGPLAGPEGDTYIRVPAIAMLLLGPILGLIFVVFLPLVGIVMTARTAFEKLKERFSRPQTESSSPHAAAPVHLSRHTRIHAPFETTYALARDPAHWGDWYVGPGDIPTERPGPKQRVGMRFPLSSEIVTEREGEHWAHWKSEDGSATETLTSGATGSAVVLPGSQHWTYEAVDGETEVTVEVDCSVPKEGSLRGLPVEALRSLEAAGLERSLANLKDYCEHVH